MSGVTRRQRTRIGPGVQRAVEEGNVGRTAAHARAQPSGRRELRCRRRRGRNRRSVVGGRAGQCPADEDALGGEGVYPQLARQLAPAASQVDEERRQPGQYPAGETTMGGAHLPRGCPRPLPGKAAVGGRGKPLRGEQRQRGSCATANHERGSDDVRARMREHFGQRTGRIAAQRQPDKEALRAVNRHRRVQAAIHCSEGFKAMTDPDLLDGAILAATGF